MKTIQLTFKDWLSQTEVMDKLDFTNPFKVSIDAPTGSGKTTYIIEYLKAKNIPFVFLTDTLLLMKQVAKDNELPTFSSADKSGYNAPQVVSVYNHISKLCKDRVVIIDEAHSMVADYGYKKEVIEDLLAFGDIATQVILLSGTPLYSGDEFYNDVVEYKCVKETPKQYNINFVQTNEDTYEQVLSLAMGMKSRGMIPVISLLDTSNKSSKLHNLLEVNGFKNIGLINSVVKDGETDLDSTHYDELINKSTISADVIITTYVQGYSILNDNVGLIIMPSANRHSYVALAQMVARPRNIEDIEIYLVGSLGNAVSFSSFDTMQNVLEEAKRKEVADALSVVRRNAKTNRAAKALLAMSGSLAKLINATLTLDEQMLSNIIMESTTNIMYSCMGSANVVLNKYNIHLKINVMKSKIECNMNETKEDKKLNNTIAVDEFFNYLKIGRYPDTNMMHRVSAAYDELKVFNLMDSKIHEILLKVFGNKQEFNKVVNGYSLRLSNDASIKNIRKEIFTSMKVNTWYSSVEIFDIVSAIVNENGGKCESKKKATEILNCLFESDAVLKKSDNIVTRGLYLTRIK